MSSLLEKMPSFVNVETCRRSGRIRRETPRKRAWRETREAEKEQQQWEAAVLRIEREMIQEENQLNTEIQRLERVMIREENQLNAEIQRLEREEEANARRAIQRARLFPARNCNIDSLVLYNGVHSYYNVGECNYCCSYCGSLGFHDENRGSDTQRHYGKLCCNQGKIELEQFPELPPTLHHLFTSQEVLAQHFRKNMRQFNAGMAMASFQANEKTVMRGVPGAFKVVGQLYRRIGSMLANEQSNAKCLQVYFLDPDYQASLRSTRYLPNGASADPKDIQVFSQLHTALTQEANNSYIRSFLTAVEWIRQSGYRPEEISLELHETERPDAGEHPGRYHLPTAPTPRMLPWLSTSDGTWQDITTFNIAESSTNNGLWIVGQKRSPENWSG